METDINCRRWPTTSYWEEFLNNARRIQLYTKPGVEYNRMNLQTFVYQQAGNAIAAEIACMGGPDAFFEKLQKGRAQLPLKYRTVIQQHAAMAAIQTEGKET